MSSFPCFRHAESHCPQCGYKLDASSPANGEESGPPQEGDKGICVNCGQVLTYEAEGRLRKATVRDIGELMTENPDGWAAIEKAQMFIRQRGPFR